MKDGKLGAAEQIFDKSRELALSSRGTWSKMPRLLAFFSDTSSHPCVASSGSVDHHARSSTWL